MSGHNLDVVQEPRMVVTSSSFQLVQHRGKRMLPDHPECPENLQCFVREVCVCVFVLGICILITEANSLYICCY